MNRFVFSLLACVLLQGNLTAEPLALKQGDHIAILGNTLADRLQHSGHLETLLHQQYPSLDLVVRNLGFSADEVTTWHRSSNFGTQDEWLGMVEADVILAFYGFNESFKGPEGLEEFRSNLDAWLKEKQAQNYGGESPRIVLFSPIAAEDTGNPAHPDTSPINTNLASYAAAMEEVAEANGVPFVDLFTTSQQIYADHEEPLTHNALHLKDQGYAALAPTMVKGMTGQEAPEVNEDLREAVADKNAMWFSRYRTVDGYNVYGGRSQKVYEDVSNYEVMQGEMAQRDVMTANRDRRIHALAKGESYIVVDDNLPAVKEVPTNLSPERQEEYPDPEKAISMMKPGSGLKVNLFASEREFPELANPVQMAWDTKNRLWVAAWPSYPALRPTDEFSDKLLIFEDTDGDGQADEMTTFMEGLNSPTGFQFYKDGVLLMQAPDLWFIRDTDGDGKADWMQRVLNGIDSADTHHTTNAMCYDPGGAIYLSDGVFHRTQVETARGPVRNNDGAIYRFEPRSGKFEHYIPMGFANPHGRVFDRWGNDLVTDATGNRTYFGAAVSGYTTDGRKHPKVKEFWERPSRPCPATEIISNLHFPAEYQGNFLNANVISFQGIFRVDVREEGSGLWGESLEDFISADPAEFQHFRPIAMSNGPDGALYFADWSQTIIGHLQHHLRDPWRDKKHGRIYRITHEGSELAEPPAIDGQPIPALLDLLKSPVNGTRTLAKVELDQHPTDKVIAAAKDWIASLDESAPEYEHHMMEALWLHQWHDVVDEALLQRMLDSPNHRARAAAARVLCYWRDRVSFPLQKLRALCEDEHPRVRLEGVRLASFYQGEDAIVATNAALQVLNQEMDYYLDFTLEQTMKQLETWWRPAITEGGIDGSNAAGITYLMGSVGNTELLAMPKIPSVLTAWLTRAGIPEQKRLEALLLLSQENESTPAAELVQLMRTKATQDADVAADLSRLLTRQPASELEKLTADLKKLMRSDAARARQAAIASLMMAEGNIDPLWNAATSDLARMTDVLSAIPMISDAALRATAWEGTHAMARELPESLQSQLADSGGVSGRFVRLSLPKKGTLTLAEVEVMSEGANIASTGKATQSSEASGGKPERAIDGNTSGTYGDNSSTHTKQNENQPWWELDLGRVQSIESISVWNRTDGSLGNRLDGFDLVVLDTSRQPLFEAKGNAAPSPSVAFETGGDPAGALQRAAIRAVVSTNQNPDETFALLTDLVQEEKQFSTAARSLRKIPRANWDAEKAGQTALAMLDWAGSLPATARSSQGFIENVQVASELAGFLPDEEASRVRRELRDLGVSVFVVRTVHEQLRYDTTRIVTEAGKPFEILFENDDVMPHNLIVCQEGGKQELGMAAMVMTPDQKDSKGRTYVPDSKSIISATHMLESGEKETLQLKGLKAGQYEFVCTFPGHWMVMWGQLIVTEDVDAYLKENPVPEALPVGG